MTHHTITSREEWLEARRDLLAAEKDLTRRSDQVAASPTVCPGSVSIRPTSSMGRTARYSLADLFDGRHQLIVQHFMLGTGLGAGL